MKIRNKKGIFTTCKPNDDCPPLTMQSEKIIHDKEKKVVNYKNAWLKIYNLPVMYFPKFFHPDPTVDRQSGFLIPKAINSKKLGLLVAVNKKNNATGIFTDGDLKRAIKKKVNINTFL